jgi:hypothetical protein
MSAPDLSKLHDFYQPAPPPWIPRTIGWYVLFAALAVAATWVAFHAVRRWLRNRYRRDALRQLPSVPLVQLSEMLKRTAMVSWPRGRVAGLTGEPWLQFLSETSGLQGFTSAPGNLIEKTALDQKPVDAASELALRNLASEWVRRHHV